jgi:hypothetical protein
VAVRFPDGSVTLDGEAFVSKSKTSAESMNDCR